MTNRFFLKLISATVLLSLMMPITAMATPLTGADTDVTIYLRYSIGSYTDDTTDANDADEAGDVAWALVGSDSMYFGSSAQFSAVYINISGTSYSEATPSVYYYSTGTSDWASLSVTFSHSPFMGTTGIKNFSFTVPTDWGTNSLNDSPNYYYIKVGADGMQGAAVDQISLLAYSTSTPEFSSLAYLLTIGIGFSAVSKAVQRRKEASISSI